MSMSEGYIQGVSMSSVSISLHPWKWDLRYHRIQSASGRYASYWNAFLYFIYFSKQTMYIYFIAIFVT